MWIIFSSSFLKNPEASALKQLLPGVTVKLICGFWGQLLAVWWIQAWISGSVALDGIWRGGRSSRDSTCEEKLESRRSWSVSEPHAVQKLVLRYVFLQWKVFLRDTLWRCFLCRHNSLRTHYRTRKSCLTLPYTLTLKSSDWNLYKSWE